MLFDSKKIEYGIQNRTDRARDGGMVAGRKADPGAEQYLNEREEADQKACNPMGKPQTPSKGIEGQREKRQKIQQ